MADVARFRFVLEANQEVDSRPDTMLNSQLSCTTLFPDNARRTNEFAFVEIY
jgi:hypothetical protein